MRAIRAISRAEKESAAESASDAAMALPKQLLWISNRWTATSITSENLSFDTPHAYRWWKKMYSSPFVFMETPLKLRAHRTMILHTFLSVHSSNLTTKLRVNRYNFFYENTARHSLCKVTKPPISPPFPVLRRRECSADAYEHERADRVGINDYPWAKVSTGRTPRKKNQ